MSAPVYRCGRSTAFEPGRWRRRAGFRKLGTSFLPPRSELPPFGLADLAHAAPPNATQRHASQRRCSLRSRHKLHPLLVAAFASLVAVLAACGPDSPTAVNRTALKQPPTGP